MATARQLTTFHLDGLQFGIEVERVQEIIRWQPMTRVPLASPVVRGLINLRGQIVTAIDLRERLGMPARENELLPTNVVVRTDDGVVSLLVDEIGDVLEIDDETFEQPPETVRGTTRELVRGVYQLRDKLLLVLDTERALHIAGAGADRDA
ncbi:MAG: chemotaxis protein CheW [Deltaproteobacteria bacterium]|nr:chemotaxis protein CheW [Deltaproteobacteria bacterium]